MAEIKGKFISLTLGLMSSYREAFSAAENLVYRETGKRPGALDPENWYPVKIFDEAMRIYAGASITGENALVTLGREVYPTIKRTSGLPERLRTPLDFILYEAEGFLANHRGEGVRPRVFIYAREGDVLVQAPAPGYNARLYQGVYLGILEMCRVTTGKVVQTRATARGDDTDEFHITW